MACRISHARHLVTQAAIFPNNVNRTAVTLDFGNLRPWSKYHGLTRQAPCLQAPVQYSLPRAHRTTVATAFTCVCHHTQCGSRFRSTSSICNRLCNVWWLSSTYVVAAAGDALVTSRVYERRQLRRFPRGCDKLDRPDSHLSGGAEPSRVSTKISPAEERAQCKLVRECV